MTQIETGGPSGDCAQDMQRSLVDGKPAYQRLYDRLLVAEASGLSPLIALSTAGNPADDRHPDPTTVRGNAEYRCGFASLVEEVSEWSRAYAWPLPIRWEAFNEPDSIAYPDPARDPYEGAGHYGCGPAFGVGVVDVAGAAKAACLWEIADHEDRAALHRNDVIVAGSFNYASADELGNPARPPSRSYIAAYVTALMTDARAGTTPLPHYWSEHPYADVIGSFGCTQIGAGGCRTTDVSNFVDYLESVEGAIDPTFEVWLTEAADVLEDPGGSGAPNVTDGSPLYQAQAAEGFLNLPRASPHVTEEYWYEDVGIAQSWDSGLVDPDGRLRASYCVLAIGLSPVAAARDSACSYPAAAWDWGGDWAVR
jgi:hypothetical protein